MDYSLACSSVHGISQTRILEWVIISFPRGSSQPKDLNLCHCQADSLPLSHWKWTLLSRFWLFVTPLDCPWNSLGQNTGVGSLFQGGLPNPGIEPRSPTLQADSLPVEPQGKPKKTGVGSLSLPQGIFLTQESNQGLAHCRQILYQLSYQGSPREASKRRKRVQNRTGWLKTIRTALEHENQVIHEFRIRWVLGIGRIECRLTSGPWRAAKLNYDCSVETQQPQCSLIASKRQAPCRSLTGPWWSHDWGIVH